MKKLKRLIERMPGILYLVYIFPHWLLTGLIWGLMLLTGIIYHKGDTISADIWLDKYKLNLETAPINNLDRIIIFLECTAFYIFLYF